jgi:hypothetical protein
MTTQRESSVEEESEWAGISESGDDDMDFEVGLSCFCLLLTWMRLCWGDKSWVMELLLENGLHGPLDIPR